MTNTIETGDRFEVTVRGTVRYMGRDGEEADVTLDNGRHFGAFPMAGAVKTAEPVKVGDKISGTDAFAALPVGSVVHDLDDGEVCLKVDGGKWATSFLTATSANLSSPRTLIHLPDAE